MKRKLIFVFSFLVPLSLLFAEDPVARTIATFDQLDGMFSSYCRDGGEIPSPAGRVQDIANALISHSHAFGANALIGMDGWGNPLHYYYSDQERVFFLISYGADGKADARLYNSAGRPVVHGEESGQDLICKHDLKSGPDRCQLIVSSSSSSRTAAAEDSDRSEIQDRKALSDAMNSMDNPDTGSSDKQRTTAQRMRRIGGALQSFSNQNNAYPAGDSLNAISGNLAPAFIKDVPRKDGWGNEIVYVVQPNGSNCWLISFGADGQPSNNLYDQKGKPIQQERQLTNNPNDDLIYSCEKGFIRAPAGVE